MAACPPTAAGRRLGVRERGRAAGVATIVRMVRAALVGGGGSAVDVYQLAYHAGVAFEVLAELLAIPVFYHRWPPRVLSLKRRVSERQWQDQPIVCERAGAVGETVPSPGAIFLRLRCLRPWTLGVDWLVKGTPCLSCRHCILGGLPRRPGWSARPSLLSHLAL